MQMSRTDRIKELKYRHAELVESIAGTEEMIRGSFNTVYRKCGKPNCRCADGRGHPLDQIVFNEGSRPKCRVVPGDEVLWVEKMIGNRREFRRQRRELKAVEGMLHKEISEFEAEIMNATAEKKAWLK